MRFVVVLALACACSKSQPSEPAAGSGSAVAMGSAIPVDAELIDAAPPVDAAKFDFNALDHEEQVNFMKSKVVPSMKVAFQEFDPQKYANFSCKTCHGKDPQKNKFKMPNPELPRLDMDALKAGKLSDKTKKVVEFMKTTVNPEMAKILKVPEYSDTEPNGFGCLECHTLKK